MSIVAFDTETGGLDWWKDDHNVFLVTWADEHGSYSAHIDDRDGLNKFIRAIENADIIVCHNAPFDVHQVRESLGFDVLEVCDTFDAKLYDTNILARVLEPAGAGGYGTYKLKALATKYLGDDSKDGEEAIAAYAKANGIKLKTTGGYRAVYEHSDEGRDLMVYYAKKDAQLTLDLFKYLMLDDLGEIRFNRVVKLEREVMPILIEAERVGVKLDITKVAELKEQYGQDLLVVRDRLERNLGPDALGGPGSDEALREALQKSGVPLHRTTKTGELSTAAFALQEFEDSHPVVGDLAEYRKLSKFLATYIGALDGNDTIHTSFHQCDAWTGRMSSSRPNMQNFPKRAGKELREVFVPRPDSAFVVCDYESIEIRLLAYYLNDKDFIKLIESGHDPHAWMAANIHGGTPEMYAKGTDGEDLRNVAKNTLFAITYGAGANRVSDMNKIGYDESRALIKSIKDSLPGYWELSRRVKAKVEVDGFVTTLMGRKQVVNKDKAYVGLNALIQGSAADVMKQGLINVDAAVRPNGGQILLVVHDEVVVEIPHTQDNWIGLVSDAMVAAADIHPTLSVEGSITTESYGKA